MNHEIMVEAKKIIIGGIYQHYKNKKLYRVLACARHSETYEDMVIYQALYDDERFGTAAVWARPAVMFLEAVEYEGKCVERFQKQIV